MFLYPNIDTISSLRKKTGLSKKALSQKAGLPANAIFRIESGETKKISHLRAREIAKALDCNVEDIFSQSKGNLKQSERSNV